VEDVVALLDGSIGPPDPLMVISAEPLWVHDEAQIGVRDVLWYADRSRLVGGRIAHDEGTSLRRDAFEGEHLTPVEEVHSEGEEFDDCLGNKEEQGPEGALLYELLQGLPSDALSTEPFVIR
jgi:hypothetical protein